jgi:flagellar motor switch protein FliN/FliY
MNTSLVNALGQELATVVGALVGAPATIGAASAPVSGDSWTATIGTEPAARGSWTVIVEAAGAEALTAAIMGLTDDVPRAAIADTLREIFSQAASALSQRDVAAGVALRSGDVAAGPAQVSQPCSSFTLTCAALSLAVSVCGDIDVTAAPRDGSPVPKPAPIAEAPPIAAPEPERLDAILDIELPLVVRFGRTELPLRALAHLGPGSLIDLGRSADDPVDLLVSNRVVARGEVVVVGGNYGVRVLDVVSPRDRVRPMEA